MSWAEIKKAINSTLGTKNFKSLDRMITEFTQSTKEVKALARSDDEYYNVCHERTVNELGESNFFIAYIPVDEGSFRLKMSFKSDTDNREIIILHGYPEGFMKREKITIPYYTSELSYDVFIDSDVQINIYTSDVFSNCTMSICAKEVNLNGFEKFK